MAKLREFERTVRLYERIQSTPFHERRKKFGRRWPWVINDVWVFAEEEGVPEAEVKRRLAAFDRPVTVGELAPVGPW